MNFTLPLSQNTKNKKHIFFKITTYNRSLHLFLPYIHYYSLAPSVSVSPSPASWPLSGVLPSHLSPMVFCSLSAVTSVPPASFPIHSVAIGMFKPQRGRF